MPPEPAAVGTSDAVIVSERLTLRPWSLDDAEAALAVYGTDEVARWLSPAMDRVPDADAMRVLLGAWVRDPDGDAADDPAQGRWAVTLTETGELVGGIGVLPLPPGGDDLEVAWQLAPAFWGKGFAVEAGRAVARHAFDVGAEELFAVVRSQNSRGAATAQRVGMEWVGETEKYYDLRLQVYRLRLGDLRA